MLALFTVIGIFSSHPCRVCLSVNAGCDGIPFGFLNGLELSRNGTIFFTDSSSKWGRRHVRYEVRRPTHTDIQTDTYKKTLQTDRQTDRHTQLSTQSYILPQFNNMHTQPDS